MPHQIHAALVPIQEDDLLVSGDAYVCGTRIAVNHRGWHILELVKHRKQFVGNVYRHVGEIRINTPGVKAKLPHTATVRALWKFSSTTVHPAQLSRYRPPIRVCLRDSPVDPALYDNTVRTARTRDGGYDRSDANSVACEVVEKRQLPIE